MDQIVAKLRKADVELGKGKKVPEVWKLKEVEFRSNRCMTVASRGPREGRHSEASEEIMAFDAARQPPRRDTRPRVSTSPIREWSLAL